MKNSLLGIFAIVASSFLLSFNFNSNQSKSFQYCQGFPMECPSGSEGISCQMAGGGAGMNHPYCVTVTYGNWTGCKNQKALCDSND